MDIFANNNVAAAATSLSIVSTRSTLLPRRLHSEPVPFITLSVINLTEFSSHNYRSAVAGQFTERIGCLRSNRAFLRCVQKVSAVKLFISIVCSRPETPLTTTIKIRIPGFLKRARFFWPCWRLFWDNVTRNSRNTVLLSWLWMWNCPHVSSDCEQIFIYF